MLYSPPIDCPDSPGFWKNEDDGMILEIYPLEPVMGHLCFWGPDIGICWTGAADTNSIWSTDEWQGHIPIHYFTEGSNGGNWVKIEDPNFNYYDRERHHEHFPCL